MLPLFFQFSLFPPPMVLSELQEREGKGNDKNKGWLRKGGTGKTSGEIFPEKKVLVKNGGERGRQRIVGRKGR